MKVIFENSINVDVRHSLFTITEYKKNTYPPFSFELKCPNNNYLCANGWQKDCTPLNVHGFKEHNHIILLFVDSDIIKYLNVNKIYTFTLNSYELPPQSTALTLNASDFLPPNSVEIKDVNLQNKPNATKTTSLQNPKNIDMGTQLNDAKNEQNGDNPNTMKSNSTTTEQSADNSNAIKVNDSAHDQDGSEPIITRKHYPLIVWFLTIWLSGCLIFGYLMFKDPIDSFFSNTEITTQDSSNNSLPSISQDPLKSAQKKINE